MSLLPVPGVCGAATSGWYFTTKGSNTEIDDFPWLALLKFVKPNNEFEFRCGGVLINDRYVLTSAHCLLSIDISNTWNLTAVRLGEWDISTAEDCVGTGDLRNCAPQPLDIAIETKIPHPGYKPEVKGQPNNIALLRLQQRVEYSAYVMPICLPVTENVLTQSYNDLRMQVAGWGRTKTGQFANTMQKSYVEGVDFATCKTSWKGIVLNDTQLCADGESGENACHGNSGGPLMRVDWQEYGPYCYLVGLTSVVPAICGQTGSPGIYTRVDRYISWILSNIVE